MTDLGELRRLTAEESCVMQRYLALAIERGHGSSDWDIDDLLEAIKTDDEILQWGLYLHGKIRGVGVTSVIERPKRRLLNVMALAIDPGLSFKMWLPALMMLANDLKVQAVVGAGRKGWARAMGAKQLYSWELPVPCPSQTPLYEPGREKILSESNMPCGKESQVVQSSRPCSKGAPQRGTPSVGTTSETGYMSDPCGFLQGLASLGVGTSRRGCA